ncbi:MAG: efflux RND transporter periplasmic adaptor subunit, partial [Myxococcota bacterium]|nr:efflux RND transporter periplasmic adaptor subunit [Myxococcota bacterium]
MATVLSRLLLLLTVALALACGGDGGGGHGGKGGGHGQGGHGDSKTEADPRILVEAATVERGSVGDHLVTTGTLESEAQADIVPEASGVVTDIRVEEGDTVRRGQLLAIIKNPSLDATADRARIELDAARRASTEAIALHAQGAVSDRELRDAKAALETAEATFNEATGSRDFLRIESPIDGTVSMRDVRLGEVAGGARAFQVVDLDRLRVVVQLPERDLGRVSVGQVATL